MPDCPICSKPLNTVRQREGLFYLCPDCNGRALTIPQVRRMSGDRFAAKLLRRVQLSRRKGDRSCPFCKRPMSVIEIPEPVLTIDACEPCGVLWFDAPTYEMLPDELPETTSMLPMMASEILALRRLKELKEKEEADNEKSRRKKRRNKGRADQRSDPRC